VNQVYAERDVVGASRPEIESASPLAKALKPSITE
jgi:hypothetical protein